MFFRRLKLFPKRGFLPAFFLNHNAHDEEGTQVLDTKKVGGWQGVVKAFTPEYDNIFYVFRVSIVGNRYSLFVSFFFYSEDGNLTPDLQAISSTTCYSGLLGGVYGSLAYSKKAYE